MNTEVWIRAMEELGKLGREMAENIERIQKAVRENLEDDVSPNPYYEPKHIAHRKRGRR